MLFLPLVGLLWLVSTPTSDFLVMVLVLGLMLVLGALWLGAAALFLWRTQAPTVRGSCRMLILAPVMVVVVGLLVASDVPLRVRWATSRSAFERVQAEALARPPARHGGSLPVVGGRRRIGSYEVQQIYDNT